MKQLYLETTLLIERLHRQFLEVVKAELDRLGIEDINNVQSLILSHIGEEELTVGELTYRGYYQGSNVSYNVKKMVENDYLSQERSSHDRRTVRVKASEKGLKICGLISQLYDRHVEQLGESSITSDSMETVNDALRRLERFWAHDLAYGPKSPTEQASTATATTGQPPTATSTTEAA
ncbi:MAG: winged helix-turn-helix transcriptional regulator [Rhodospirillaceae bacterium]|nr:winged helix-turn-helix transcriptional regulator [Rhodospirillaceae bacterium]MBT5459459.1 winged helix-turn-helix transcriptional regulator [Rhodospirillaceae bacterium]